MTVRAATLEYQIGGMPNCMRVTWTGLLDGDTGAPVIIGEYPDRTVHVRGTFGVGGSVDIEGSNDLPTETPAYVLLTDPQGNPLTKGAAGIEICEEAPLIVRPNCNAGDGDTSLTVRLLCRRPRV